MTEPHAETSADPAATNTAATNTAAPPFSVVGIGASAGGLAALEGFFSALPDGPIGIALVVVQHLAPDHESILTELLQRCTRLPVIEVAQPVVVAPDTVYVVAPNRDLTLVGGRLDAVVPTAEHGQHLPIDSFFTSLAQAQGARAMCVVLSGSGSDGSLGARAVAQAGGFVAAQAPASAEFDSMPAAAIATGCVAVVAPPAEIPALLLARPDVRPSARAASPGQPKGPAPADDPDDNLINQILEVVRNVTHHDFSNYKRNTIARRIERRMVATRVTRLEQYLTLLGANLHEVETLFADLLIGVTSFFRDPEAFAALQALLQPLLDARPRGAVIRVWVPGCSSGAEAYSLAILLSELFDALGKPAADSTTPPAAGRALSDRSSHAPSLKLQLFATDADKHAIDVARRGVYPASIATEVTPERLARYFVAEPDGVAYRVARSIRDVVVFSDHDVVKDPPFSKLDLISCRNVFIYLEPDLQRQVLSVFQYALNPDGLLLLGSSETIGDSGDLFATLDRQWKIYQRKLVLGRPQRPALSVTRRTRFPAGAPGKAVAAPPSATQVLTEKGLLAAYGAAGVLVDEQGEILYLHGRTGLYLEPAPGEAGLNILRMARTGLRAELSECLRRAVDTHEIVHSMGVRVKTNGDYSLVNVMVRPARADLAPAGEARLFLVIFEAAPPAPAVALRAVPEANLSDVDAAHEIAALQQKLRAHEEDIQTYASELGSYNEELQSTIEELQSTIEELETSKEELQSVNEELTTVNAELNQKVGDLSRVNNDMINLLAATGIGTIFVDFDLHIQRFTPTVTAVINLIPSDIGRSIGHIVSNLLGYDRLVDDLHAVLESLVPREVEVQTRVGAWYSLRIRPYRTVDNVIEGAVITFVDITEMRALRPPAPTT